MGRKGDEAAGPKGARRASAGAAEREDRGRFSISRKRDAVVRLLRGESLEEVSRQLGVTAARLSRWREEFLEAGQHGLRTRPADERDLEIARLRAKVGELTMDNELLNQKIDALEGSRPLGSWRSRS